MRFDVTVNLAELKRALSPGVARTIKDFAFAFRARLAELYGGVKTGRVYRRPRPASGFYRASAPGEPPAIRSGRLFRSLRESFPDPLSAVIVVDTPYAKFLEIGTARAAARPFIKPALESVSAKFNGARSRFN